jgi:hypothetical protein
MKHFVSVVDKTQNENIEQNINEKVYKLIHFLLITGEEEEKGFVSSIH